MNKFILKGSFGFLFLSVALFSCKSSQEATAKKESVGINVGYMDKSTNPVSLGKSFCKTDASKWYYDEWFTDKSPTPKIARHDL